MITSPQNPKLKLVRALMNQSKSRRRERKFVLEGVRLIQDVIEQGYQPDFILHHPDNPVSPEIGDFEVMPVEESLFNELSDTENSQGVIAVFDIPELATPDDATLLLALDGLRDPGNLGTILRTAAAAGVDGILLLPGTVDAYNSKVVRAGMGAHFRLPMVSLDWYTFENRFGGKWVVWCAEANTDTARPYTDKLWSHPTILIIGSEAHGISDDAKQYAVNSVHIPMAAEVESLNSAIAAAVILFEIRRQRTASA